MNKNTYQKIASKDFCQALEEFQKLDKQAQDTLIPGLSRTFKSCFDIIEVIASGNNTYEEIAGVLKRNPSTIQQSILAMEEGGLSLPISHPVGRPQKQIG